MTTLFKQTIFEELRIWQDLKDKEFDLIKIMTTLYAKVIMNCAFGPGKNKVKVLREFDDGTAKELLIHEALAALFDETTLRIFEPFNIIFPMLNWWTLTSKDRRYGRNS
eukprot:CAMPEP_0176390780 /NCGR_PEP_ID=MMETSP0126-20121128/39465_1 /TAXON_ID=141414 ORGANISM="Strombidinopsis acuminatum, Strain SPMC142" /NCGR_SAMPLE_ID=MMETSP0126 /ASSEMBLY_ACC=CAM_ASM_000229 /LENGTH=108 /DNA_ID=CAMNT_0017760429 /DNA_START=468 /DNA_END=794 /DNA_ORIENTATION=+